MNNRFAVVASIVLFLLFVLLLEGNGYVVHKLHYDMGASWTPEILAFDGLLKIGLYQLVIVSLSLIHRKMWLTVAMEAFWCSCTQDLIFYAVWNKGVFPQDSWVWMPNYQVFGAWTTTMQMTWSSLMVASSLAACYSVKTIVNYWRMKN